MNRIVILCLSVLWLSSCSLFKPALNEEEVNFQKHRAQVASIETWQLAAKMSVTTSTDTTSFTLYWQQDSRDYRLDLTGTLGLGGVSIVGNDDYAELITDDGRLKYDNAQLLVLEQLGLDLPIDSLLYWVRGIDNPKFPYKHKLDSKNLPRYIEQQGWRVSYSEYHQMTPPLPYEIKLTNAPYSAKIVIKKWTL